jgi:hypothetical protein
MILGVLALEGVPLWRDVTVPDDWRVLGIRFRPTASKSGRRAYD